MIGEFFIPPAFISTDVAHPAAILVCIDKRGVHHFQLMDVAQMSLRLEAAAANVKVIAGETVVGECLVESVTCVFTNGTPPNSMLVFREYSACTRVKQAMVMHQGVLWRR